MENDNPSRDRFVGKTFGSYHIERRLGSGGMGIVYVARDDRLRRKVALKMLRPGLANDDRRKKRFMREACYAASITHPNVVAVYEACEIYGIAYMTMELVPGKSLRQWLLRGRLDVDLAVGLARDITRALARAHERGIVHRDLKPDNVILYEPNPSFVSAKVLDFGLAKAVDPPTADRPRDTDSLSFVTAAGVAVGTAGYMSPEQARGWPVDARSDLYAVGVMLHEMITGQRPAIVDADRSFVTPSLVAPTATRAIDDLVFKCLARDPAKRFPDAEALLAALDEAHPAGAPPRALAKTSSARAPEHRRPTIARVHASPGPFPVAPLALPKARAPDTSSLRAATTASESEAEMRRARMRVPSLALEPSEPRTLPPPRAARAKSRPRLPLRLPLLGGSRIPMFIAAATTMFAACFASGRLTAPAMASTTTFPAAPPLPAPPSAGEKPQAIDCSTPFTVDEHGVRVVRRECLWR